MICYQCKNKVEYTARFCNRCGAHLEITPQMVEAAVHGNVQAQSDLILYTQDDISRTIRAIIGRDAALQDVYDDVLQDTYCRVLRNLSTLRDPRAFRGWVREIAKNRAIDYTRRKRPRVFLQSIEEQQEKEDSQFEVPDIREDSLPDVVVERQETSRLLHEILDEIPDEKRMVIMMRHYEGITFQEIANTLGLSKSTVVSRYQSGRKLLENRVMALKKQGVELYSLSPIPFVLLLLRSQDLYTMQSAPTILQAVTAKMAVTGGAAAAGAGSAAGGSAASASGAAAGATGSAVAGGTAATAGAGGTAAFTIPAKVVAVRVAIGVAAAAVVGGGGYAVHEVHEQRIEREAEEMQAVQNETAASVAEEVREEVQVSPVPTSQAIPTSTPAPTPTQGPPPITDSEEVARQKVENLIGVSYAAASSAARGDDQFTFYYLQDALYGDRSSMDSRYYQDSTGFWVGPEEEVRHIAYALIPGFSGNLEDIPYERDFIDSDGANKTYRFFIGGDAGLESLWLDLSDVSVSDGKVIADYRNANNESGAPAQYRGGSYRVTYVTNEDPDSPYPYRVESVEKR